jgi:phospholipase A1
MNTVQYRAHQLAGLQKNLLWMTILVLFVLFPGFVIAGITDRIAQCAAIKNDIERLKCFDDLAGRKSSMKPITLLPAEDNTSRQTDTATGVRPSDGEQATPSVMSRQWELDAASRENAPVIRAHRPNYFLPVAYNSSPNKDQGLDVDSHARAQNNEAKFQLSFKVKLWEDIVGKDVDLWFAYTQLSFWQLYNSTFSSPFRETNYEPEVLLNFRMNYDLLGLKGRVINLGINHQSNGRAKPLSRSWNRIVANFGF